MTALEQSPPIPVRTLRLPLDGPGGLRHVVIEPGPVLLAGAHLGPTLAAHRGRVGALPKLSTAELISRCDAIGLRGRGGAGFPLARKLETTAKSKGRPLVVVNLGEGEPASHKDAVLARLAPHLILDGAVATAQALGAREIHLVSGGATGVDDALRRAVQEREQAREHRSVQFSFHSAADVFVAGQASAVVELMAGRPNLPVTAWVPVPQAGHKNRPTMLSNAETFAHLGAVALLGPDQIKHYGTAEEPGTTLLTIDGDVTGSHGGPRVVEVAHGTPWEEVLPAERLRGPVLLGGYHGTWASPGTLLDHTVSRTGLQAVGLALGAGVVLPLDKGCPVRRSADLVEYLASQSARRCGPCLNGLPALARAVRGVVHGDLTALEEVKRVAGLVERRGACAHPDGTARMARSLVLSCDNAVQDHLDGRCEREGC